ncbi:hypothetical protein [Caulobacter sp. 1776]|uniref:hypothetical protein n=1 Tax=Caulobacter sp. 1776 TaxID=3156420 RepID=UPI003395D435
MNFSAGLTTVDRREDNARVGIRVSIAIGDDRASSATTCFVLDRYRPMIIEPVFFTAGAALVLITLRDVFDTVVVPGQGRATLKIARRIVFATLPLWRRRASAGGVSTTFAPFTLVSSFVIWMLLLTLGFGAMTYALADAFRPAVPSLPQAIYVAGSALVTIGLSEIDAMGAARWVIMSAGFCGVAVMTLAVTYLLGVQNSIAERDAGIFKLKTSAGEPPSAIGLLERYAKLDARGDIPRILRDGRDWCAKVLQSHASHPTLIYFRSSGTQSGWPAALGAMLDLTLVIEFLLDVPEWRGPAALFRQEGTQLAETLGAVIGLTPLDRTPSHEEIQTLISRLRNAGYRVRKHAQLADFAKERSRLAGCVAAAAAHLGAREAPLLP